MTSKHFSHTLKKVRVCAWAFARSLVLSIHSCQSNADKRLNDGPDSKLDSKNHLHLLPELADLHSCNNTLYFEARRHEDLYLWACKTPNGPSIKLHVQNVHTMDELKMTGNCLKGSRGVLSFDAAFEETEWGRLTKELFTHVSFNLRVLVIEGIQVLIFG
jgi:hypothetical protein